MNQKFPTKKPTLKGFVNVAFTTLLVASGFAFVVKSLISWHPISGVQMSSNESASQIPENDEANPLNQIQHRKPSSGKGVLQKSVGEITASLVQIGTEPVTVGSVITLKGTALANRDVSVLEYDWRLPAGIEFVSGNKDGNISNVHKGDSIDFVIQVRIATGGAKRFIFRAFRMNNGEPNGDVATLILGNASADSVEGGEMKSQAADTVTPSAPQLKSPRSPEEFRRRAQR